MNMVENPFYANQNYELFHIPESNVLIVKASGHINMELGKEAWMKVLDWGVEHKVTRWISEESGIQLLPPKGSEWWVKVWFPLAMERLRFPGKRLLATILSERFYAEMSTKQMVVQTVGYQAIAGEKNKYLEHVYFKTFDEAYQWITNFKEEEVT